jgi:hypothetical protein
MEEKEQYGAESIQVLEGLEAVRKRPAIWFIFSLLIFIAIASSATSCKYIDGQKQGRLKVSDIQERPSTFYYDYGYKDYLEEQLEARNRGEISMEEMGKNCQSYEDSINIYKYSAFWDLANEKVHITLKEIDVTALHKHVYVKCYAQNDDLIINISSDGNRSVNGLDVIDLSFDLYPITQSHFIVKSNRIPSELNLTLSPQDTIYFNE